MTRRVLVDRVMFAVSMFALCAIVVVQPAISLAEEKSSDPSNKSFYQGVWVGEWTGWQDTSVRQEAIVEVGPEIRDGVYEVKYTWGDAKYLKKTVPGGKIKTEGMMRGDSFCFSWEKKNGKFEMALQKKDETTVKARLDRPGPTGPMARPYSETILKRK